MGRCVCFARHVVVTHSGNAAGATAQVRIQNPKGEQAFEQVLKANPDGSFSGEYMLPKDAALGVYNLHIPNLGGVTFRVEEYKKPEFEVTVEVKNSGEQSGSAGVQIAVFRMGVDGKKSESESHFSRLKFAIPLLLPPGDVLKLEQRREAQ